MHAVAEELLERLEPEHQPGEPSRGDEIVDELEEAEHDLRAYQRLVAHASGCGHDAEDGHGDGGAEMDEAYLAELHLLAQTGLLHVGHGLEEEAHAEGAHDDDEFVIPKADI